MNQIKIVALDVDGVLTDGTFWWGAKSGVVKRFCFLDIMGVSLARKSGIKIALISGERGRLLDRLAGKLKIADVFGGIKDKAACLRILARRRRVKAQEVCYIGDDINDIPAFRFVGFPVAVKTAHYRIFRHVAYITKKPGGHGAVREVVDMILKSQAKRDASKSK